MNYSSLGDLAQAFQSQRNNVRIKSDLARLTHELASGRKSEKSIFKSGDYAPIVSLERSLITNLAFKTSITEAGLFANTIQTSLGFVQSVSSEFGPALLMAGNSASALVVQTATADAKEKFGSVVAAFNTQVADRYAFSGGATDRPALADADTILTALEIAISAETTALGIALVIDTWFDTSGGGFESVGYTGSTIEMSPFRLSETESVDFNVTGSSQEIRSVLKGLAIAALVGDGALSGNNLERSILTSIAGEKVLESEYDLTLLRAKIGSSEARIDKARAGNVASKYAFEVTKSDLTAIDPYQTATELEAITLQLETLYTLTVRLSQLSLSAYLR